MINRMIECQLIIFDLVQQVLFHCNLVQGVIRIFEGKSLVSVDKQQPDHLFLSLVFFLNRCRQLRKSFWFKGGKFIIASGLPVILFETGPPDPGRFRNQGLFIHIEHTAAFTYINRPRNAFGNDGNGADDFRYQG